MHNHEEDQDFIHPLELVKQKPQALNRRMLLKKIGAIGGIALMAGCGNLDFDLADNLNANSGTNANTGSGSDSCSTVPSETKGPYPLDGTGGSTNALSSIYRTDILGDDISSEEGVPLLLSINLQDVNNNCAGIENAAVYVWHCDQSGAYSGYSSSQNGYHYGKTFCRGIALSNSSGQVNFTSLFPGWYHGRITHIHFAVYLDNDLTSTPHVSQIAFPQEVTEAVYEVTPYSSKGQNTSVSSFAEDNIFSDGTDLQLASVTGSVATGLIASLSVGIPG
ncbi:MAG: protocatechuate dioxygenase [Bdellovibrionota bacterium]|nr:protocatechuate dioxygenase [Bdellovibrionota bacterium]